MTELAFAVLDVVPEPYAVAPNLVARLRVEETTGAAVHALALRAQVRIDVQRRRYDDAEEAGLLDLFGPRERWIETLRPLLWMHTTAVVPGFSGSTEVDVPLPCTYDLEVTGAKYFAALQGGDVPLVLMFSGTVFTRGITGFGVEQVPWHSECSYRLPVSVWRDLMDHHFPGGGWLRLDRDTLESLVRYRSERGFVGWTETFAALLPAPSEPGRVVR